MRRLPAFAVATALCAACSGEIDFGEYPGALLDARCIYYERCGLTASRDHCLAFYTHSAIDNPSTQAAYDAGKLAYNAGRARDCINAFGALSCDATEQSADDLAVCNEVITGTLAAGETCAFALECTSGNCVIPLCTMACCTGTCGPEDPAPSIGEPCTSICADGAYCDATGTCQALLPAGASCSDEVCTHGLYCKGRTPTTSGTCTSYPHIGEPCDAACAEVNALCLGGTCVAYAVLAEPCSSNALCSGFYTCTAGTCSLMPTRGMACSTACSDESWCNNTICEAQKTNGAACVRNDECLSHFCSRTASQGTCSDVPLCF